jgi:hypothetical protein
MQLTYWKFGKHPTINSKELYIYTDDSDNLYYFSAQLKPSIAPGITCEFDTQIGDNQSGRPTSVSVLSPSHQQLDNISVTSDGIIIKTTGSIKPLPTDPLFQQDTYILSNGNNFLHYDPVGDKYLVVQNLGNLNIWDIYLDQERGDFPEGFTFRKTTKSDISKLIL